MLVQTTLPAQNEISSHIINRPNFVKGMTKEMDSCKNENLMKEEENVDGSKNKETPLKRMGHEGEHHEAGSEANVKEKELVLNNGRRLLTREIRQ
jgi:hypothetical protein